VIAEIMNLEAAELMYENFSGQQVTFPKRFINTETTNAGIIADYGMGAKIRDLVRKYKLCESTIRKIINEEKQREAEQTKNDII
jgi:Mor family transcriptional regulator